jgi:hypothetical protein
LCLEVHRHSAFHASTFVVLRDLGEEEREDRVGLCFGNAYVKPVLTANTHVNESTIDDRVGTPTGVDIDALPTCGRVHSLDRLATDG